MRRKRGIIILFFLFLCVPVFGVGAERLQKTFPPTNALIIDLRDLLHYISRAGDFSLVVDSNVRGIIKRPKDQPDEYWIYPPRGKEVYVGKISGKSYEEILKKTVVPLGFTWGFFDGCLFVGRPEKMRHLWEDLKLPLIPSAKLGAKVNAEFHDIDLHSIFNILQAYAGIGIQGAEEVKERVSLRIVNMPWERVLRAIVYLNNLRMIVSDYSIVVTY